MTLVSPKHASGHMAKSTKYVGITVAQKKSTTCRFIAECHPQHAIEVGMSPAMCNRSRNVTRNMQSQHICFCLVRIVSYLTERENINIPLTAYSHEW
jgi:hypothetical protein